MLYAVVLLSLILPRHTRISWDMHQSHNLLRNVQHTFRILLLVTVKRIVFVGR